MKSNPINILILCQYDAAGILSKFNCYFNRYPRYFQSEIIYFSEHSFAYEKHNTIDAIGTGEEIARIISRADVVVFALYSPDHPAYRLFDLDYDRLLKGKKVIFYSFCSPYIWDVGPALQYIKKHNMYIVPTFFEEIRRYDQNVRKLALPLPIVNRNLLRFKNLPVRNTSGGSIRLFHSPTSVEFKNTHFFMKTAGDLKRKYDLEIILNQGRSYEQNLKAMAGADIVFDEMWSMSLWGQSGIEAAALGKPVMVYLDRESIEYWQKVCGGDELPFVICNPQTLEEKLTELIRSPALRREYGRRSHHWFWHSWSGPHTARRYYEAISSMETFR